MSTTSTPTPAALSKLKVAELREKLEAAGLNTDGTKPILLAGLKDSLNNSLVQTPTKSLDTPGKVDTPSRRSKRLSISETASDNLTPLKKSKVREASVERPSTPIRRSRRLSGASVDLEVPEVNTVASKIETIAEDAEESQHIEEEKTAKEKVKESSHVAEEKLKSSQVSEEKVEQNLKETPAEDFQKNESKELVIDQGENKKVDDKDSEKENVPIPVLLDKIFSSKQIPRQKPKSGRFWKGQRGQFRQIKRDRGQRNTFEQRLKMKEEKMRNKEVAEMLIQRKNEAKEELRKKIEENKAKKLENERKTEQYQVIKNPAKLKRMKKKQLRMLEKRDILPKN